jgi:uncharacterized protein YbbC (DUF1343 family)/CubicO group peptidase (beta-lactamase class C family)
LQPARTPASQTAPIQAIGFTVIFFIFIAGRYITSPMRYPLSLTVLVLAAAAHAADFSKADSLIQDAVKRGDCPGAVLIVGRRAGVVYEKAYGSRALQPQIEAMTLDTIFDLASLSKPVGCATSVIKLIDQGKVDPKEKVRKYLPEFTGNGKENITVEHLLLHWGGLIPDNSIKDYAGTPAQSWENICKLDLKSPPGTRFAYTDVGFIVLGKLVERVSGKTLDQFAADEIFKPLGMNETGYNPPAALYPRCAPTEKRDDKWIRGQVHDPRSWALGGVAGHAGLFSTGGDLARYCRMILNNGELDGARVLSEKAIALIATPHLLPDGTGTRSYGFDVKTGYSQPLGERFTPMKSFGHTGFTGTAFWISPPDDAFFILLTNSVHPDGKGKVLALRRAVSTAVAEALLGSAPKANLNPEPKTLSPSPVLTGLDVLKRDNFKLLENRKLALITNHTGRDRDGNHILDLLAAAKNVKLVCIFSPEHGLYGAVDEKVGHAVHEKTGLKIWSLYGETRRPNDAMLEGVDTLLFDIQDIGARFYTYPATMANCMQEAAKRNIKMIVLDRPNPIGPMPVDGMIADKKYHGFTAFGPLPLVHGMTVGELARLFNTDYQINCDLTVVECENYNRNMWFDQTGLMWINPSPNMRNLTQATIYPAIGMIEFSNVSVGRGTDQPFEYFGAPWIDGKKLAAALNAAELPGLRFVPTEFTPASSKHAQKRCEGCYVLVTDRAKIQPARTGLTIAWTLKKLFGDAYQIDNVIKLMANDKVMTALRTTDDPAKLAELWQADLEHFKAVREKYLIYPR